MIRTITRVEMLLALDLAGIPILNKWQSHLKKFWPMGLLFKLEHNYEKPSNDQNVKK